MSGCHVRLVSTYLCIVDKSVNERDIGIFSFGYFLDQFFWFWLYFGSVSRFLCQKSSVSRFWYSYIAFYGFSIFKHWVFGFCEKMLIGFQI